MYRRIWLRTRKIFSFFLVVKIYIMNLANKRTFSCMHCNVAHLTKHWLPVDQTQVKTFCHCSCMHASYIWWRFYRYFLPGVSSSEELTERGYGSAATNIIDERCAVYPQQSEYCIITTLLAKLIKPFGVPESSNIVHELNHSMSVLQLACKKMFSLNVRV